MSEAIIVFGGIAIIAMVVVYLVSLLPGDRPRPPGSSMGE